MLDTKELAEYFNIPHQMRRGIFAQFPKWAGPPRAALIEDNHAPMMRVKEAPMHRTGTSARATMQEEHGLATGIAHLFPIHDMPSRKRQEAGFIGGDIGEKVSARHGLDVPKRAAKRNGFHAVSPSQNAR
jgi:hypothetical protein